MKNSIHRNLGKTGLFLEVRTDALMDTGNTKNAVPDCMCLPVHLPTGTCRAAFAFHKQSKDVDVTEIQLQFTWQFDARTHT